MSKAGVKQGSSSIPVVIDARHIQGADFTAAKVLIKQIFKNYFCNVGFCVLGYKVSDRRLREAETANTVLQFKTERHIDIPRSAAQRFHLLSDV